MATILQTLIKGNKVLQSPRAYKDIAAYGKAKKDIAFATNLLMKGYNLDDDLTALIKEYKSILKVPDAKSRSNVVTAELMSEMFEKVFPMAPHNHFVMLCTQNFDEEFINYISNGTPETVVVAMRSMADKIENKLSKPMTVIKEIN